MENNIVAEDSSNESHHDKTAQWYYKTETVYSTNGAPLHILRAYEVPRIDDRILKSIFYLYPSVEAAEAGEESGGTGFLVSVQSENHPHYHDIYGVTNDHVIRAPGYAPVVRLSFASRIPRTTIMAGNRQILPLAINQWTPHPNGDDLSITPLGRVDDRTYGFYGSIPSSLLLTHDVMDAFDIGPGDDVYMVGRFVHHAGTYFNQPTVRSGIISMMPTEIEFEEGAPKQEAFLIEMRSISGHSGSPVMWKLPLTLPAITKFERNIKPESGEMKIGPWLIGIDCGNFKYFNSVYEVTEKGGEVKRYKTKGPKLEAKSHSGLAIVIPAWKLQELLNLEEFVMARKEADRKLTEAQENSPVERDVARPQENEDITQEGFQDALKRASRKIPSSSDKEKNKE